MNPLDPRTGALLAGLIAAIEAAVPAAAQVEEYFVDDDAPPGGDGRTWQTAFGDLQDALESVGQRGGRSAHVRVAEGVYKPDRGTGQRWHSFDLRPIPSTASALTLTIEGGFAGLRWANPNKRNPSQLVSVLSGDLRGDDGPGFTNREDNSHHVVTSDNPNGSRFYLSGFTITGGAADDPWGESDGGGVRIRYFAGEPGPYFEDCRFVSNTAASAGGAVFAFRSQAVFRRCAFVGNAVRGDWNCQGGAVWNGDADVRFYTCEFVGNSAEVTTTGMALGGALSHSSGAVWIANCVFSGNRVLSLSEGGGGAVSVEGELSIVSSTLVTNEAEGPVGQPAGGAVRLPRWSSRLGVANSVFWLNRDPTGPGEGAQVSLAGTRANIDYSCVQGWTGVLNGVQTHGRDPMLIDLLGPDGVPGTGDEDLRPGPFSPCIDAGDNDAVPYWITTDVAGLPRFADDLWTPDTGRGTAPIADMGAHEFQGSSCYADCDDNLRLDARDVLCFQERLGAGDPAACDCDTSTGPVVCDIFDVLCFLNAFGAGCP